MLAAASRAGQQAPFTEIDAAPRDPSSTAARGRENLQSRVTGAAARPREVATEGRLLRCSSVRRGVSKRSAVPSSSSPTTARTRAGRPARPRARRSRRAVGRARASSSSAAEPREASAARSSRMYSLCTCDRSYTSMRRARARRRRRRIPVITWMTSSMSSDRNEQALHEVQALRWRRRVPCTGFLAPAFGRDDLSIGGRRRLAMELFESPRVLRRAIERGRRR